MDIVDQYYWLGYAKKTIDSAADRLNAAAASISTLVGTFWTIYITTFVIGAGIKKLDEPPLIMTLLILPIPLMILSYLAALWAQLPGLSFDGLDPRSPDDVMEFYNDSIKWKKIRLITALVIFFLAGLSLTFALTFANFTHEKTDHQELVLVSAKDNQVMVTGDLKTNTLVRFEIATAKGVVKKGFTVVSQNDHFDHVLPAPPNISYKVRVSWQDITDTTIVNNYTKYFPFAAAKH